MSVNYMRAVLSLLAVKMYLPTSEPVHTPEQACNIVFTYGRRWQIEMSLRFTKSEMAFGPPHLLAWQARLKFLLIASLAYAFLLSLLPNTDLLFQLISTSSHRTGKWSQDVNCPPNFGAIHVFFAIGQFFSSFISMSALRKC